MSVVLTPAKASKSPSLFLTSFDPSDLPGSSIDPLGFERGYLFLADKILPGLTNVASHPRYFAVLCAGAHLAKVSLSDPPRVQYQRRLECLQRLERLWALANVLAERAYPDEELPTGGVRGVSYARKQADRIGNARKLNDDFDLLSRQTQYGAVGIYAAVADGMRLLERKTFALTPDLGELIAADFIRSSGMSSSLIKAVRTGSSVKREALVEWGLRSHVSGELFHVEKRSVREALNRNPVRSRMLTLLGAHPASEQEDELSQLKKLINPLKASALNRDLLESVTTIIAYEECYRIVSLGFERMLWLCKNLPSASLDEAAIKNDPVLRDVADNLPGTAAEFLTCLDVGQTEHFRLGLDRLADVRTFLEQAAKCCQSLVVLSGEILARHREVQLGKFDRGRRKMPWIESNDNKISLTMTRVGGLKFEATKPDDISPHPYRLETADSFIGATE